MEKESEKEEDSDEISDLEELDEEGIEEDFEEGEEEIEKPRIDQMRILTPADFKKIEELKKKRPRTSITEGVNSGERIDPTDLLGYRKKRRLTLEERLEVVKEGRTKYEFKKKGGGSTNLEKERKKNFMMVKKSTSVRNKLKRSLKQQQNLINKSLKSFKMVGKKMFKKRRF